MISYKEQYSAPQLDQDIKKIPKRLYLKNPSFTPVP